MALCYGSLHRQLLGPRLTGYLSSFETDIKGICKNRKQYHFLPPPPELGGISDSLIIHYCSVYMKGEFCFLKVYY